jgi:anti-sigma factor RsiW
MSECRRTIDALAAYVDGQLPPGERAGIERHLAACPPCRRLASDEDSGHRLLRHSATRLLNEPLPPGLRGRCEAIARTRNDAVAGAGRFAPWWRVRLVPVLLTVVVMIFGASAFFSLATKRSDALLAAQLTVDHSKCFKLFPPDGVSADAGSIQRIISEQYGWNVHVPSSSPEEGIQLIGVRRCLYGDGLVPHVMYRIHGEDVSLFVLGGAARKADELVTLGHRSQIWSRDGNTFVLVSAADAGGMASASRYVMQEAR